MKSLMKTSEDFLKWRLGMECNNETAASLRDREVMERFDRNIKQEGDGHYKVVFPWKSKKHLLRSNYAQVKVRLEQI